MSTSDTYVCMNACIEDMNERKSNRWCRKNQMTTCKYVENEQTIQISQFDEFNMICISQFLFRPTTDVFYQGNRVARIEGPDLGELKILLDMYQFMNSELDLFSEDANQKRKLQWGDGKAKDMTQTPRTTARFLPAYDWNTNNGFFDEQADKAQQSFEDTFGNWLPDIDDDDDNKGSK
jgi:hypothetical protein